MAKHYKKYHLSLVPLSALFLDSRYYIDPFCARVYVYGQLRFSAICILAYQKQNAVGCKRDTFLDTWVGGAYHYYS